MFGIDPLTTGALMVLAAGGGNVCDMAKATEINVVPVTQDEFRHRYDLGRDAKTGHGHHKPAQL